MAEGLVGTCSRCGIEVIGLCSLGIRHSILENYVQRQLRLNTLQNHTAPFCRDCASRLTVDDFPRVLTNIRLTYEHAWVMNQTPEPTRRAHRAEMAAWEIIGFAEEIPGLEHPGVTRPIVEIDGRRTQGYVTRDEALGAA